MARRTLPLTDKQIRAAKPKDKPFKLFDGGGLFLLVNKTGSKGWRLKYRFASKEKLISLGSYPATSLADARNKRAEAKELLAKNIDPSIARQEQITKAIEKQSNTFQSTSEEWLSKRDNLEEKTKNGIERTLKRNVYPYIGATPITTLSPKIVLDKVLRPLEERGVVYSAHKVRSIMSQILRYGVACGLVERDVTADLKGALKPIKRNHRAALTEPHKIGQLLRSINDYEGTAVVKAALQLHPLVVTRPGELRHMEWCEIDFESATWEIPSGKMKMKNPHIVPLSKQAITILKTLQLLTGDGKYVFPSIRTTVRPISDNTLNASLRRIGYTSEEMTSHGWRAVFRTLTDEQLGIRVDYVEHQLAHQVKDPLGRAYNRTKHLKQRRELMQTWADYLDRLAADIKGKVIPIRTAQIG